MDDNSGEFQSNKDLYSTAVMTMKTEGEEVNNLHTYYLADNCEHCYGNLMTICIISKSLSLPNFQILKG